MEEERRVVEGRRYPTVAATLLNDFTILFSDIFSIF
jgi:hypothetical protein